MAAGLGTAGREGEKERSCPFLHGNSLKRLSYISLWALDVLVRVQTSRVLVHSACPESGPFSGINNPPWLFTKHR